MLNNYFKIAFRNLYNQKVYSLINVFGLAIGMACCLLILAFVRNEWSFDRFHEDAGAIYRVDTHTVTPDHQREVKAGQPLPLAPTIAEEFPDVIAAARLRKDDAVVKSPGMESFQERVVFTDASFFDVFTFRLLEGDAERTLSAPEEAVLTPSLAQKYYGEEDPLGRTLLISFGGSFEEYVVTAVVEEPPANSSFSYGILLPFQRWPSYNTLVDSWSSWVTNTYVRLSEAGQGESLAEKLPAFAQQHYEHTIRTWQILQWISEEEGSFRLQLEPMTKIHFASHVLQAEVSTIDPRYPFLLSGLALAVLLIACINFTTLAVGRATRRAKEVGMRKVMGANRIQLMKQFWGEALLLSVVSLLVGLALTELFLPLFNNLTNRTLTPGYLDNANTVFFLVGLILFSGFLAGAYPALYLSRFHPMATMKERVRSGGNNRWMQALVLIQFALSIFFIVCVLVVSSQLRFMTEKDLGFDKERMIVLSTHSSDYEESEQLLSVLKNELRSLPGVVQVSGASSGIGQGLAWNSYSKNDEAHFVYTNRVDYDFVETLRMDVIEGRGFSESFPGDQVQSVVVNEALVRDYEWDNPIGETVDGFSIDLEGDTSPTVIGVVKDYHFESLHTQIQPMVLFVAPRSDPFQYVFVRIRPDNLRQSVASLEAAWQRVAPDRPFTYYFLDDDLDRQYQAEEQWQQLVMFAAVFAVLIACLGLIGLAAFTSERRTKEIGIRKVLGATTSGITTLLSKDFLKLVVLANVLAWPMAYVFMNQWLENFAYRITLDVSLFILAGVTTLFIALLTVSYQSIRAATADPVRSLRYE